MITALITFLVTIREIIKYITAYILLPKLYYKFDFNILTYMDNNFNDIFDFETFKITDIPYNHIVLEAGNELYFDGGIKKIDIPVLKKNKDRPHYIKYDGINVTLYLKKRDYAKMKLEL